MFVFIKKYVHLVLNSTRPNMAIKTPNKTLKIRIGRVSGNTDIFVFDLIMTFHEISFFFYTQILIFISYLK